MLAPTAVRTRAPSATANVGARAVKTLPRMKMTSPARSAWLGRMMVLRMGAQQAKVMLKMVTSCAAVVVDTLQVGADFFEESGEDKGVGAHSEGHEREGP